MQPYAKFDLLGYLRKNEKVKFAQPKHIDPATQYGSEEERLEGHVLWERQDSSVVRVGAGI